jgi:hypothetical protein
VERHEGLSCSGGWRRPKLNYSELYQQKWLLEALGSSWFLKVSRGEWRKLTERVPRDWLTGKLRLRRCKVIVEVYLASASFFFAFSSAFSSAFTARPCSTAGLLRIPVKWATDSAEKWATDSGN